MPRETLLSVNDVKLLLKGDTSEKYLVHPSYLISGFKWRLNIGFIRDTDLIESSCLVWGSVKDSEVAPGLRECRHQLVMSATAVT